ncbi:MAG: hypothetical protein ACOX7N_02810 [Lawsonibacter sp.]|jgi:hypothetical protein
MELRGLFAGGAGLLIPCWYMSRRMKEVARQTWPVCVSMGFCGIFLWDQILFSEYLASRGNISTWLDTSEAVAGISGVLMIFVWILNGMTLWIDKKLEEEEKL